MTLTDTLIGALAATIFVAYFVATGAVLERWIEGAWPHGTGNHNYLNTSGASLALHVCFVAFVMVINLLGHFLYELLRGSR